MTADTKMVTFAAGSLTPTSDEESDILLSSRPVSTAASTATIRRRELAVKIEFQAVQECSIPPVFEVSAKMNSPEQSRTATDNPGTKKEAHQRFKSRREYVCKYFLYNELHNIRRQTQISAGFWRESRGTQQQPPITSKGIA